MSLTTQDLAAVFKKHPVGVSCGLLALVLGVATYFRGAGLPELEARVEERSALGERQKANLRNAISLDEQLAILTAANTAIHARAITAGALALNLQYFYQLEAELGFELLELRQLPAVPAKPPTTYLAVPYVVAVSGTYPQLLTLIRRLEDGSHFARINTANLGGAAGAREWSSGPEPILTLNLNLDLLGKS